MKTGPSAFGTRGTVPERGRLRRAHPVMHALGWCIAVSAQPPPDCGIQIVSGTLAAAIATGLRSFRPPDRSPPSARSRICARALAISFTRWIATKPGQDAVARVARTTRFNCDSTRAASSLSAVATVSAPMRSPIAASPKSRTWNPNNARGLAAESAPALPTRHMSHVTFFYAALPSIRRRPRSPCSYVHD